ncbi:hypothetical protein [Tardiphaga sp. 619_E2_N8_5]|uniref:hypothetical protein n=1 Tax=unclassified Tardiphaga TaxID=2631404 RepID=UPI003F280556
MNGIPDMLSWISYWGKSGWDYQVENGSIIHVRFIGEMERGRDDAMTLANVFGVLGPALICVSVVLQFRDWQLSGEERQAIEVRRGFIEILDDHLGDLRKEDKTRGLVTEEGIDIGHTFEILQAGVESAMKINRKNLRKLVDQIDDAAAKRARSVKLSLACTIVGTIVWGAASFV